MCRQNVYCSVVLIIMKHTQIFKNSFFSQVIITFDIIQKPAVKKVYVIYWNNKEALSEQKLEEALS